MSVISVQLMGKNAIAAKTDTMYRKIYVCHVLVKYSNAVSVKEQVKIVLYALQDSLLIGQQECV